MVDSLVASTCGRSSSTVFFIIRVISYQIQIRILLIFTIGIGLLVEQLLLLPRRGIGKGGERGFLFRRRSGIIVQWCGRGGRTEVRAR